LRWKAPTTWQLWADSGLDYDSTLTFPQRVGFRCGTCYEYPVFNATTRTKLRLIERPLIAMDVTLLDPNYMGLDHVAALEHIARLANQCRAYQGDFVLLWHNTQLIDRRDRRLYADVVDTVSAA
jgi:hypothetical protein